MYLPGDGAGPGAGPGAGCPHTPQVNRQLSRTG